MHLRRYMHYYKNDVKINWEGLKWARKYISENSEYIFAGGSGELGITTTAYSSGFTQTTDNGWDQAASTIKFGAVGNQNVTFAGGKNYDGGTDVEATGALQATVGDLSTGYDIFANTEEYEVDFIKISSYGNDINTYMYICLN